MIKFISDEPWSRITTLTRRGRRNLVAVPFMHGDASRLLPLRRGDILKVNIMSCQVNPEALRHYQRQGVNVFTVPDLHAKVFVLGKSVIVGSTNVSTSSEQKLQEAVVETKDPKVHAAAQKFIDSLESYPVTPKWLKKCAHIYKKPLFGPGTRSVDPERWCLEVMRSISPANVTHDGRNHHYISLPADSIKRAYVNVDYNSEGLVEILLSMYPGDTGTQARAFYSTVDYKKLLQLRAKGWEVASNLHFGFAVSGMCSVKTHLTVGEYIRFWKQQELRIGAVQREANFNPFFRKLLKLKLIASEDISSLERAFTHTKRKSLQIRPGIRLQYQWSLTSKLPDPKLFAHKIRSRMIEALTCFELVDF